MSDDLDLTDEQLDELVNSEYVGKQDVSAEPSPTQETAPAYSPVTFTANGKEVVADDPEKLKQWASMGYNYGQHMEQFKKQQEEFNQKNQDYNNKFGLYEQIDKAASDNPDWWNHVQSSFQNRGQQNQVQAPTQEGESQLSPELAALKEEFSQEVNELKSFKNDVLARENARKMEQEDTALKNEVQSIRENHSDLDWTTPDENGKSLEFRILEHAEKNGINSFDVAFKHMMHDELLNRAKQASLDTARKEIQRNHKIGLLGETPEPLKKYTGEGDIKNKTMDDIEQDILKEYGLG